MNKDQSNKTSFSLSNALWNLWCIVSVIGIWPRFIEHRLIKTTRLKINFQNLPQDLQGLKIVQISDLHLQPSLSQCFLDKLTQKVNKLSPDLILFTGDFLCFSQLDQPERLQQLLCSFKAPYGCYAILGNHDYMDYASINHVGDYDVINREKTVLRKGWGRLFDKTKITGIYAPKVKDVPLHHELLAILAKTPFKLLHNETVQVPIKNSFLNLCGLGEHMLGKCLPTIAFQNYNSAFSGIILAHNPDSLPALKSFPGDLILCGHTHGAQINIPGLRDRFTLLENPKFKRGLKKINNHLVYINRGLSSIMPFRWFSPPEILFLTLGSKP